MLTTNSLDKNVSEKLLAAVLESFKDNTPLVQNVNTQLIRNEFNKKTGDTIRVTRDTQFEAVETFDGDLSAATPQPIIIGDATAYVQNMISVLINMDSRETALFSNNVERAFKNAGRELGIRLERNFNEYVLNNTGLYSGTYGSPISKWGDVLNASTLMKSIGVPEGSNSWTYLLSPAALGALADKQTSLGAGDKLVSDAWRTGTPLSGLAGMNIIRSNALPSRTIAAGVDRVGAVSANPVVTYLGVKSTLQQTIAVSGFEPNLVVKAGEVLSVTGVYRVNHVFRSSSIVDNTGTPVEFSGTVVSDVTLDAGGAGNITISGAGIYEAGGAYNTVSRAIVMGDIVTLKGAAGQTVAPSIFFHKDAFTVASVRLGRLDATETSFITDNATGMNIRMVRFSDGNKGLNSIRLDMLPAFATLNPYWAGQSFGTP